jgi:hypothetical protein
MRCFVADSAKSVADRTRISERLHQIENSDASDSSPATGRALINIIRSCRLSPLRIVVRSCERRPAAPPFGRTAYRYGKACLESYGVLVDKHLGEVEHSVTLPVEDWRGGSLKQQSFAVNEEQIDVGL